VYLKIKELLRVKKFKSIEDFLICNPGFVIFRCLKGQDKDPRIVPVVASGREV
jgi:hypothetical protein